MHLIASKSRRCITLSGAALLILAASIVGAAQATPQQPAPAPAPTPAPLSPKAGVIKLMAYFTDTASKKVLLQRKRFYLIRGSRDQNKDLVNKINTQAPVSRDCYYHSKHASPSLLTWLRTNDCETIYCRKLLQADVDAVDEFQTAKKVALNEKALANNSDLALEWLPVYLDESIRSGFFKQQQDEFKAIFLGSSSKVVSSVMTDQTGIAYFTKVLPGTYLISNILPTELKDRGTGEVFNCEVTIKEGELAKEYGVLLSEPKDAKEGKCRQVSIKFPTCGLETAAARQRSLGTISFWPGN